MELQQGRLPDMAALRTRFIPDAQAMPDVPVLLPSLTAYDELGTVQQGAAP